MGRFALLLVLLAVVGIVTIVANYHGHRGPAPLFVLLLGLLLLQLGGAGIAALGARRLGAPVESLVEGAQRMAAGDYSARVTTTTRVPLALQTLLESFNTMAERIQASADERQRLLADTSHELRTPLTALRGEIEAMIDGVHPADAAHLRSALEETRVLERLIDDLRTLSLAEAGALRLHPEPTDLVTVAQDAATGLRGVASAGGVRIEVRAPNDLPIVNVDAFRTREVISNLLMNALRYAPRDSAITVEVGRGAPGMLFVAVDDRGPGIPPDLLASVFERYTRSDTGGSGLGLAIARRLVEAHGGTIRAEQPAAGGTRIRFEVPTNLA